MSRWRLIIPGAVAAALLVGSSPVSAASTDRLADDVRGAFVSCELVAPVGAVLDSGPPSVNPATCMGPLIDSLYASYDLPETLEAFAALYAAEDIPRYHCHSMFHQLGRAAVPSALSEPLRIGPLWHNCGSGFMHGLFENMNLPENPREAGVAAAKACAQQEFADDFTDLVSCVHSVGHAIFKRFASAKIGEESCRAVVDDQVGQDRATLLEECYSGVYMNDAETRVNVENPDLPESTTQWEERFPVCQEVASPVQCAINYSLYAVRGSEATTASFLDWCSQFDNGPDMCMRRVAFDLSTLAIIGDEERPSQLCYELSSQRGHPGSVCQEAFQHATAEAGVVGGLADSCKAAEAAGVSCTANSSSLLPLLGALGAMGLGTIVLVMLRVAGTRRPATSDVKTDGTASD